MVHLLVINVVKALLLDKGVVLGYAVTAALTLCMTVAVAYLLEKYFVSKLYLMLKNSVIKI